MPYLVRDLQEAMKDLTDLENPNSVAQMKSWLSDNGLETESGKKRSLLPLSMRPKVMCRALSHLGSSLQNHR